MGSKRSLQHMLRLRDRLYVGMAGNGIIGALADQIWTRMQAFANYGFPESHAISFALIVYASAWCKLHYPRRVPRRTPARPQLMGFYSPHSLVADARRHGVVVHRPDIHASLAAATLEPHPDSTGGQAVRLGRAGIRDLGDDLAQTIVDERDLRGPYDSQADLARRVRMSTSQMEALATAGAFDSSTAAWPCGRPVRPRGSDPTPSPPA